jgi:nitrite reductase/ring-hydroxylating ferredoxin subunit
LSCSIFRGHAAPSACTPTIISCLPSRPVFETTPPPPLSRAVHLCPRPRANHPPRPPPLLLPPQKKCPHQSFPLSRGTPFDIEDFGLVLSAGLHCPKHGWSFDLFRGNADRGGYRLKVWEVQLRGVGEDEGDGEGEVWVRRKQRMG